MEDLEKLRDGRLEELETVHSRITVGLRETADILSVRGTLGQEFVAFQAKIDRALNHALSIYRDANRSARQSDPPPTFNEPAQLALVPIPFADDEPAPKVDKLADGLSEDLTATMDTIVSEYEVAIRAIPTAKMLRELGE